MGGGGFFGEKRLETFQGGHQPFTPSFASQTLPAHLGGAVAVQGPWAHQRSSWPKTLAQAQLIC